MRNLSKETIVEKALYSCIFRRSTTIEDFNVNWLEEHFAIVIDLIKRDIHEREEQLRKYLELEEEYYSGRKNFVLRYYKRLKKRLVLKADKYEFTYGILVKLLDKLERT